MGEGGGREVGRGREGGRWERGEGGREGGREVVVAGGKEGKKEREGGRRRMIG